jgi:threonyl-tRNA synthetase
VRGFTQDDAHIFCRPDQIDAEIRRAFEFSISILRAFGLTDFTAYLSTRPAKYVGEPARWDAAIEALQHALHATDVPHEVDEGGGAFYGPKIDLKVRDAIGREWQLSTIQFDFNLPQRFGMEYIGDDGQAHQPYMVHRALLGSMERFFGVLIEHYAGAFPFWIAPVQVTLIPITDKHRDYAEVVQQRLAAVGIRTELNDSRDRMQAKIRHAQLQKVPYMLIIGDKEQAAKSVSVRLRSGEDLGSMPVDTLLERLQAEVAARQ